MLSKISVFILGFLAEQPLNPYEITKLLDYLHVRDWFPIAPSSVYATIKALGQKGLITGETQKEGNMPEKTVYSVTEKGEQEFLGALREYLAGTDLDRDRFNIAGIFLCHLPKEEVLSIITRKVQWLEKASLAIERQICHMREELKIPPLGITVIQHNFNLIEAERKTLRHLAGEIQNDETWDHFVVKDLSIREE